MLPSPWAQAAKSDLDTWSAPRLVGLAASGYAVVLALTVRLEVLSWNPANAWTDRSGHALRELTSRLAVYAKLRRTDARRLARRFRAHDSETLEMPGTGATGIQHVLESLGATVRLELLEVTHRGRLHPRL